VSVKINPNLNSSQKLAFKGDKDNSSYAKAGAIGLVGGALIGTGASYLSRNHSTIAGTKDTISPASFKLDKGPVADYVNTLAGDAKITALSKIKQIRTVFNAATAPYRKTVGEAFSKFKEVIPDVTKFKASKDKVEHTDAYKKARAAYTATVSVAREHLTTKMTDAKEDVFKIAKDFLPKEPVSKITKGTGIGAAVGLAAFLLAHSLREEDPQENYKKLKPIS